MPNQDDKPPVPQPTPEPEPEPIIVVVPDIERVEYGEPDLGKIGGTVTIEIDNVQLDTGLD